MDQFFKNSLFYYINNCSKSIYWHPYGNGHHVIFFFSIWIYTIKNCAQGRYCFSAVTEFQTQSLWRQITCAGHWEHVCCKRQKKEGNPCLQILHSRRQMEKRVSLPEVIRVQKFRPNVPPLRHPSPDTSLQNLAAGMETACTNTKEPRFHVALSVPGITFSSPLPKLSSSLSSSCQFIWQKRKGQR